MKTPKQTIGERERLIRQHDKQFNKIPAHWQAQQDRRYLLELIDDLRLTPFERAWRSQEDDSEFDELWDKFLEDNPLELHSY